MLKKIQHEFPKNWKDISQEKAIEHIKYLLEHYKEYDMRKFGDNGVVINEIKFFPSNVNLRHGVTFKYMNVNLQKTYSDMDDIYKLIQQLINVCKVEIEKREQEKAINAEKNAKKEKIKNAVLGGVSVLLLVGVFVGTVHMVGGTFKAIYTERARKTKIEKAVRDYEKTLPNHEEYKQTQQKIANYRDSLNQVIH